MGKWKLSITGQLFLMALDNFKKIDQFTFLHSWLKEQPEREVFFFMIMEKEYLISWRLRARIAENQTNSCSEL